MADILKPNINHEWHKNTDTEDAKPGLYLNISDS